MTEHGWPGPDWADDQADDQHAGGQPDHDDPGRLDPRWDHTHGPDSYGAGAELPEHHWPDPGHDLPWPEQQVPAEAPGHDPGAPHDPAHRDSLPQDTAGPGTAGSGMGHAGADPDARDPDARDPDARDPDAVAAPTDGFPPPVDVGALPEPVDGFPWVDPGTLGAVPVPQHAAPGAADPAGLAAYAAMDLDPGRDPWDQLAASDDPATAALARFWRPAG